MAYPISLSDVKSHLRIDTNYTEDDNYIEDFVIPSAVEYCTNFVDSSISYTDASCPFGIKRAMLICCGDSFDVERSSYTLQSLHKTDIVVKLLMPFRTIKW
jgi:hypothetical protein